VSCCADLHPHPDSSLFDETRKLHYSTKPGGRLLSSLKRAGVRTRRREEWRGEEDRGGESALSLSLSLSGRGIKRR
jgi:hypothetical protein